MLKLKNYTDPIHELFWLSAAHLAAEAIVVIMALLQH